MKQLNRLDDRRAKKTLQVAAAGEFKTGNDLFGHGSSAEYMASLEYCDGETSTSQIRGSSETIMATANYQCIPFLILQDGRRTGGGGASETPPPHIVLESVRVD